jgi:hypothetical protein
MLTKLILLYLSPIVFYKALIILFNFILFYLSFKMLKGKLLLAIQYTNPFTYREHYILHKEIYSKDVKSTAYLLQLLFCLYEYHF